MTIDFTEVADCSETWDKVWASMTIKISIHLPLKLIYNGMFVSN